MLEPLKMNGTAILVFANSSKEELKHKAMANGEILFEGLTKHTLSTVIKTGLPYFLLTEKEQCGNSFGERFVNAINYIFDKGFESVITIGNDTPQIKTKDILKASRYVSAKKFVLGPSTDGGFYMMGLNKSQFDESDFRHLPWKTNSLTKKITGLITALNIQVIRLRTLLDLDSLSDLKSILKGYWTGSKKIIRIIISLLAPAKKNFHHLCISVGIYLKNIYFNKGSPYKTSILS